MTDNFLHDLKISSGYGILNEEREGDSMRYLLLQKNFPVALLQMQEETGYILSVDEVYDAERMPLGTIMPDGQVNFHAMTHWWKKRSIPMSRSGIAQALRVLQLETPQELLTKCLGLSLSDQYWIRPENMQQTWEQVNFFDNDFSEDIGNILFGSKPNSESLQMHSPDCTADGWLKKKWKIVDGRRCLVKGGSSFFQEPFNEVIASRIAERLNIPHVEYRLAFEGKNRMPVSVCGDFITPHTELITASEVSTVLPMKDGESKYEYFLRCCEKLKIPHYRESLEEMLVLDFLIANQDRHMGNFGVIRNVDTLEFVGFAPLFDCGTSLRYDTPTVYIEPDLNVESQPFCSFHDEQIRLVQHPERFDLTALSGLTEEVMTLFESDAARAYMDEKRQQKLLDVLECRTKMLNEIFLRMDEPEETETFDMTL